MKTIYEKIKPGVQCAALYETFTRKAYAIKIKYRERNKVLYCFSLICNNAETSVKRIYV